MSADKDNNSPFFMGEPRDHHGDIPNNKLPKGGPTPEERERMVANATKEIARKYAQKPLTDTERVQNKAKQIHRLIVKTAKFIHEQGRLERLPNREIKKRLQDALSTTYRDEFYTSWSKEELVELCTYLHVGITIEMLGL